MVKSSARKRHNRKVNSDHRGEIMVESEKGHGFMDVIKEGLNFISQFTLGSGNPSIAEITETIMKDIDTKLKQLEKRIMRKLVHLLIIGLGVIFLIFALFFVLKDYLLWSNAASFFAIGIVLFVGGLMLKMNDQDR